MDLYGLYQGPEETDLGKPSLMDDLFHSKIDLSGGPDACWPWMGARNWAGYGKLGRMVEGKRKGLDAHRVALEEKLGRPILSGLWACHHCDNPPCCNPAHLFEATPRENTMDMVLKGRHGRARFTEDQVHDIRFRYRRGEKQVDLAREFNVSRQAIRNLVLENTWGHLEEPVHLRAFTQDMILKCQDRSGENNGRSKLTEEIVLEIRQRFSQGERQRDLVNAFQLGRGLIHRIVRRKSWRHI